ncbi:MAG: type IV toxin-antitoxin system AbiEi family antitoxin [Gammaproteobacteria bacterium]|nr:type IV toxin-antitoxin system AbiEi family antitoxin [Gammaproteobacteria bacterium]
MQTAGRTGTRINSLLAQCPLGVPMTSTWLATQAVSPQLLQNYRASGWLSQIGRGAWIRAGTAPTLVGAIYALQKMQSLRIYPAARTALELQGRTHYIPLGNFPSVQLSSEAETHLPEWFKQQNFAQHLRMLNSSILFDPIFASLTDHETNGVTIKVSTPERAMLEYCQLLPKYADFEEARQLMEGLTALRSDLLQSTLQACRSVKAKRLFLALAEAVGHRWFKELNLDEIELGRGKRTLPIAGGLHPRFEITVPHTWIVR